MGEKDFLSDCSRHSGAAFYTPVVSIKELAKQFGVSYQAASTLVGQLEKSGILKEVTGRKRDKRYVYDDYLKILTEGTKV